MRLRTTDLAVAIGGSHEGPDVEVNGASIDSRSIASGQLFVPVIGERDGHEFIRAALAAGAAAYLTSGPAGEGTAIMVGDTTVALQAAGQVARSITSASVIGITGSVGKTSVKDLLAAILSTSRRTAASERSFNNELGVPLTLLNAPDDAQAVVVEMGARDVGHIAELCAIAAPTIGIVTKVAAVHTEVFGTIDDVARAKAELVQHLPAEGTAVLNAADPRVLAMAWQTDATVLTFGEGGEVQAVRVTIDEALHPNFQLRSPWGDVEVQLGVRGAHQVDNALAAAAAALAEGSSLDEVAVGLAGASLSPWRMELSITSGGARVLNDAYNANPTSVAAALDALLALPADRHIAVLGVMAELGATSEADHAAIGEVVRSRGVELITVDAPAYGGRDVPDVETAVELLGALGAGDAVLVKGSRVAGLERLADLLLSP